MSGQGIETSTGALAINGRIYRTIPFIKDSITEDQVGGESEYSFEPAAFEALYKV
jgi:hypothetical protein